jgi:hypothetical protein
MASKMGRHGCSSAAAPPRAANIEEQVQEEYDLRGPSGASSGPPATESHRRAAGRGRGAAEPVAAPVLQAAAAGHGSGQKKNPNFSRLYEACVVKAQLRYLQGLTPGIDFRGEVKKELVTAQANWPSVAKVMADAEELADQFMRGERAKGKDADVRFGKNGSAKGGRNPPLKHSNKITTPQQFLTQHRKLMGTKMITRKSLLATARKASWLKVQVPSVQQQGTTFDVPSIIDSVNAFPGGTKTYDAANEHHRFFICKCVIYEKIELVLDVGGVTKWTPLFLLQSRKAEIACDTARFLSYIDKDGFAFLDEMQKIRTQAPIPRAVQASPMARPRTGSSRATPMRPATPATGPAAAAASEESMQEFRIRLAAQRRDAELSSLSTLGKLGDKIADMPTAEAVEKKQRERDDRIVSRLGDSTKLPANVEGVFGHLAGALKRKADALAQSAEAKSVEASKTISEILRGLNVRAHKHAAITDDHGIDSFESLVGLTSDQIQQLETQGILNMGEAARVRRYIQSHQ